MANESLKDELEDWVGEYPSIRNHGWTQNEISDLTEALWGFLEEQIGPAQEKLMNDLAVARERADLAERKAERRGEQIERLLRDSSSD